MDDDGFGKILVVDDVRNNVRLLQAVLYHARVRGGVVGDGRETGAYDESR